MPTTDELNAGFDAIEADLHSLISTFVPPFFQTRALQYLESKQGRDLTLDGVRKILEAAEKVRSKHV